MKGGGGHARRGPFLCNKDIGLVSRDSENKAPMTQECETGGQRLGGGAAFLRAVCRKL